MPVGVIVVAGGRGARLGGTTPKQFLELGGRSLVGRSVDAFDRHPAVSALVVVLPAEAVNRAHELIGPTTQPLLVVAGGERRQDSVAAGLAAMPASIDCVLIHDAARPFVGATLIDRVIAAVARTGAAVPALPSRDTVKRRGASNLVAQTIPRDEVWLAQTPQGFRRHVIDRAVALGQQGAEATDEAMLVEQLGLPVEIVNGETENVKITTKEDWVAAVERVSGTPRVGTGYDLHQLVAGRPLVLAGVTLPFEKGPLGHSDGDVVCHALADAMFGATGLGDIGQHFPNSDPRWKDVAGLDLLARAVAIVGERGWRVANADVTVILEQPKLVPHLTAIRTRVADVLGVDVECVSVKGKTNELMDAVGRGEAIASHAVALLVPGARS